MTHKFTAEEVRENIAANRRHMTTETELQLTAYADTLSKPADSGRVGDETATVASMRTELVAKIGDCCMGGDPLCAGGCLAEKAAKRNAEREAALAAQGQGEDDLAEGYVCLKCGTQPTKTDLRSRICRGCDEANSENDVPDINDQPYECGFDNGVEQGALRFMRWLLANKPYAIPDSTDFGEPAINGWYRDFIYSGAHKVPSTKYTPPASPAGVPDCVIVLLNHLETLMDEGKLAEDAIPTEMWNAVSMHNLAAATSAPEGDGGAE